MRVPDHLRDEFLSFSEGIYPDQDINQMKQDGYNPLIIGYFHNFRFSDTVKLAFS